MAGHDFFTCDAAIAIYNDLMPGSAPVVVSLNSYEHFGGSSVERSGIQLPVRHLTPRFRIGGVSRLEVRDPGGRGGILNGCRSLVSHPLTYTQKPPFAGPIQAREMEQLIHAFIDWAVNPGLLDHSMTCPASLKPRVWPAQHPPRPGSEFDEIYDADARCYYSASRISTNKLMTKARMRTSEGEGDGDGDDENDVHDASAGE